MDEVFLYVITFFWGNKGLDRYPMPDLKTCEQVIERSKSDFAQGDENESGVVMFCAGEESERYYGGWNKRKRR